MSASKVAKQKNNHIDALFQYIFVGKDMADEIINSVQRIAIIKNLYVVFLSICDAKSRAVVVKGRGETVYEAWHNAEQAADAMIENSGYDVKWVKADIVNCAKSMKTIELNKELIKLHYRYFFREGIALKSDFDVAFIEAEINANKLINYYTEKEIINKALDQETEALSHDRINKYQIARGEKVIESIPEKIISFSTMGFFCDDRLEVHELFDVGPDCGRRIIEQVDTKIVSPIIESAYDYLANMIMPNGEFVYGYYPIYHNEIDNYNILRHAGSVWSLIKLYNGKNDAGLLRKIDSAIEYLTSRFVIYRDDNTAYVVERKSSELKLGGNALTVLMLTEYMECFDTDKYMKLLKALSNGILEMQNRKTGEFFHIWSYPSFEPLEEFRTIYYDGEATYALIRAYALTGYDKYLNGAKQAIDNFIKKDYTRFRDHWVSYALNEITKYIPDVQYFEFAAKNVEKNLKRIHTMARSAQTSFELLTVAWQTLMRAQEKEISSKYLRKLDKQALAKTIYYRAQHLLNGYFFPEYAMYMKYPNKVVGAFFVREDNFKIRIDEIQHYILGYALYCENYEEIAKKL